MAAEHISISLACGDYDRTRALRDGRVRVDGVNIDYVSLPAKEIFARQTMFQEWDVSEMSLGTHLLLSSRDENPFVAIPVFPSRSFRHGCLWINTSSNVERPEDLRGKRVGVPDYHMTAAIWVRGILQDEYGVKPDELRWVVGGLNVPGHTPRVELRPIDGTEIEPADDTQTLDAMLASGELDAVVATHPPRSSAAGHRGIRRLFADHRRVEREYWARTKTFPIMHCVVLRRDVHEAHPWLAMALFQAFEEAKRLCLDELTAPGPPRVTLPWLEEHLQEVRSMMGEDYWPYGLERNRRELSTLARYSLEQGLLDRELSLDEMFVSTSLAASE